MKGLGLQWSPWGHRRERTSNLTLKRDAISLKVGNAGSTTWHDSFTTFAFTENVGSSDLYTELQSQPCSRFHHFIRGFAHLFLTQNIKNLGKTNHKSKPSTRDTLLYSRCNWFELLYTIIDAEVPLSSLLTENSITVIYPGLRKSLLAWFNELCVQSILSWQH